MIIVKDLSTKGQLLQFSDNAFLGLNPFLHISDRFFWMHEQRIETAIHIAQYEEVQVWAYVPQHMND